MVPDDQLSICEPEADQNAVNQNETGEGNDGAKVETEPNNSDGNDVTMQLVAEAEVQDANAQPIVENRQEKPTNDGDGSTEMENVPPQSTPYADVASASTSAANLNLVAPSTFHAQMPVASAADLSTFIQPAPLVTIQQVPVRPLSPTNSMILNTPRKNCYRCEESFIKERSLIAHLKYEHNVELVDNTKDKESESISDANFSTPGKFVKVLKQKKRTRANRNDTDDDSCDESKPKALRMFVVTKNVKKMKKK